jgi:hypothetical protein
MMQTLRSETMSSRLLSVSCKLRMFLTPVRADLLTQDCVLIHGCCEHTRIGGPAPSHLFDTR